MPLWLSSREPSLDTRVYRAMAVGRLLRIVVDNVSTRTKVAAARGFGIGFRRDPQERLLAGRHRTVQRSPATGQRAERAITLAQAGRCSSVVEPAMSGASPLPGMPVPGTAGCSVGG